MGDAYVYADVDTAFLVLAMGCGDCCSNLVESDVGLASSVLA